MVHYTTFSNLRVTGEVDFRNPPDASTQSVTATGSTTARTTADRAAEVFNVKNYGAVGDSTGVSGNGTDDSAAIQRALNAANTAGGGKVYLPKGIYRKADTTATLVWYSNTTIEGDGDASVLFHDDTVVNARSDLLIANSTSNIAIRNMKILGTADTYGVQTNQSQCLTGGVITNLRCENVTFQGLRYMSTAFNRVNGGIFTGNRLKNCMRDGIRCTHSYNIIVNGNTFDNVSDDNVALHSDDSRTEVVGSGFVVTNNTFTAGQSVKILGGKRIVISGNTFARMLRTPINVTLEYGLTEGASPLVDVTISNNVIQDTFSSFGSNEVIKVKSYPYSVGGLAVQPGINATPYAYNWLNNIDTGTQVNVGAQNIRIENNTISRTLAPVANYSLYGFGSLYDTAFTWGYDPAITDTSFACHGISVYGPVRGLRVCGNMIAGLGITVFAMRLTCVSASTYPDFIDVLVDGNVISDCPGGGLSLIGGDTSAARNLVVRNNVFDVDPYFRQTAHSADNTWTDITSSPGIQTTLNTKGCVVTGNWFSNCASCIGPNISGVAYVRDNFVLCDATSIANDALNKGVRNLTKQYDFIHMNYDGDPTSGTFGEISSMPLSTSSSIPTSGWYGTGHFVKSASNIPGSTGYVLGWLRLTTGTGHVSGTDWAVVTIPSYDGSTLSLPVLAVAPASPANGMLAYADGSGWNPGAGAGVYARQAGAWVKL